MKPKSALRSFLLGCSTLLAISYSHAATLTWDANGATAGQTDGAGAWDTATELKWWTGSTNVDWTSGDSAIFGNGGAGGAVGLTTPTTVGSFTLNPFSGTYTLGSSGQAITLNSGITMQSGIGAATIASPVTLGGAQTWKNDSTGILVTSNGTNLIDTAGYQLTIDGPGPIRFGVTDNAATTLSGSGALVKNGNGVLFIGGDNSAIYSGDITINGGVLHFGNFVGSLGTGNITITNGALENRSNTSTLTRAQGSADGEIQITGGISGFGGQGSNATFSIGDVTWGSVTFKPTQFILQTANATTTGQGTFTGNIDLNGADRTIRSDQNPTSTGKGTFSGVISTSTGTAGLIKVGTGLHEFTNTNTYNGATTIQGENRFAGGNPTTVSAAGSISLSGDSGRLTATSALKLNNGGTLRMINTNDQNTVDRINSAAIAVSGGGSISWENTAGANSFAETMGAVTLTSGQFNVNLTANQTAAGDQVLTLGGLTRNGTSSATFSAAGTGPQIASNKNMIVVTGAGSTATDEIIGAWATTGTTINAQTDYAVFDGDYVKPLGATSATDDTGWTTTHVATSNYAWGNGTTGMTVTTSRNINTLRHTGGAETLTLTGANLGTFGILNGGTGVLTMSRTGATEVVTLPTTDAGQLHVNTGTQGIIINAPITDNTGTMTLVKSGSGGSLPNFNNFSSNGTLALNGVNTYTGDTIINAGVLRVGTNNSANGAVLGSGNYAGNIAMNAGSMLHISTNANQTLSGVISGEGALMKTYTGTLTLSGNNTYTGRTSISPSTTSGAGVLSVSSLNSVVGGTASSSLGAPTTVFNGTIDLGGPLNIQGPATLRYTGPGETTDRVVNIRFGATTSRTIEAAGSGLLKFTNPFTFENHGQSNTQIILAGNGDGEIVGGLASTGAFPFIKNGTGTWTLGGPVGTTAATTVSAGTLILNGAKSGSGAVAVNGTSTLGGSGTIAGAVTVAAGAKLAPGSSAGTMTFTGDLNISAMTAGAGTMNYELGPIAASDQIVASTINIGELAFNDFSFSALSGLQNGTYTLIQSGGITGDLDPDSGDITGAVGSGTGTLQITGNDIELVVTGIGGGPSGFAAWQSANTTGGTLADDHDGDGVDNGTEYFLGGTANTTGFTALPGVTNTLGTLSVTWTKAATYGGTYGSGFVVETSDTLATGSWATETLGVNVTVTGDDVKYTFPAGTKNFARLKVTGP